MADGLKVGWNESSLNSLKQQLKDQIDKITQEKIELGVNVKDDVAVKQLNSLLDSLKNVQDTAGKAIDLQINTTQSKQELAGVKGSFEDIINTYKQLGKISVSPTFDKNGMIKDFTIQLEQINGLINKIKYNVSESIGDKGNLTPISFKVDNIKEVNKLDNTLAKVEEFKNRYNSAIKEIKGIKIDTIAEFQKSLNSLNVNNFKEKASEIKDIFNDIEEKQKQMNNEVQRVKSFGANFTK